MRHLRILWAAWIWALLTAATHASHLKGGTLSWEPLSSTTTTLTVKAHILINVDYTHGGVTGGTGPVVRGVPTFNLQDEVTVVAGDTDLYWGDSSSPVLLEGYQRLWVVEKIDEAAQVLTLRPKPNPKAPPFQNEEDLTHTYTGVQGQTFQPYVTGTFRDEEELANRSNSTMRLASMVKLYHPVMNHAPVFALQNVTNPLIIKRSAPGQQATVDLPVATDADAANGDTIQYRFIANEAEASPGFPGTPWETLSNPVAAPGKPVKKPLSIVYDSINLKWQLSWDTSDIPQTIKTFCVQVVAEDFAASAPGTPRSKTTIEFQVWIDEENQPGYPEITTAPFFNTYRAVPGTTLEFRVIGTDRHDPEGHENSRLILIYDQQDLPEGAVIAPTGGFAGDGGHEEGPERLESVFHWEVPENEPLDTEYELSFRVVDEDGKQSPEFQVTVIVAEDVPLDPLVMTIGPVESFTVPYGTPVSFTVTGSCATSGLGLTLSDEGALPQGATMSPSLPASGTGSVSSTFNWTPTLQSTQLEAYYIEFSIGDQYGREATGFVRVEVTAAPLELTITPALGSGNIMNFQAGVTTAFTVTGHCADPAVPLTLSLFDGTLPTGATLTSLPQTGPTTVSATFSWTPNVAAIGLGTNLLVFRLGDGLRDHQTQLLEVAVRASPPKPVITLLEQVNGYNYWDLVSLSLKAEGGYGANAQLSFVTPPAGYLDPSADNSPLLSEFIWRVTPGQIPSGKVLFVVWDEWRQSGELEVDLELNPLAPPPWWTTKSVLTGGGAQDHAMATKGQLKAIATKAFEAIEDAYPDLATETFYGEELGIIVSELSTTGHNYEPVTQGQVKELAWRFYDVIGDLRDEYHGNPWTESTSSDDKNYAPATVGQIKTVFSFPVP